jgi:hypothetical protein
VKQYLLIAGYQYEPGDRWLAMSDDRAELEAMVTEYMLGPYPKVLIKGKAPWSSASGDFDWYDVVDLHAWYKDVIDKDQNVQDHS